MKKKVFRTLFFSLCLILGFGFSASAEEQNPEYTLTAPSTEGRLTYSEDGKTATLFAPNVTRTSGWYDTNKHWDGKDGHLCWAASCSNAIAWYLDSCEEAGIQDVSIYERNPEAVFEHFRDNWNPDEGYDPLNGFSWYFTGETTDGKKPDELLNDNTGGYLKDLPYCSKPWRNIDMSYYVIVGDYQNRHPFVSDDIGFYYPYSPLGNHSNFSKTIREQLSYGVTVLNVSAEGVTATGGHAITLWGCDYDVDTGLVSKIYVTDSDDEDISPGKYLKEIGIEARDPDEMGIKLTGYYLSDLNGKPSPITKLTSSTLLYADNVVNAQNPVPSPENLTGDVNGDGKILSSDALLILRHSAKLITLDESQKKAADVNADSTINSQDALSILRFAAHLIDHF